MQIVHHSQVENYDDTWIYNLFDFGGNSKYHSIVPGETAIGTEKRVEPSVASARMALLGKM